jgi:hypothetical protein
MGASDGKQHAAQPQCRGQARPPLSDATIATFRGVVHVRARVVSSSGVALVGSACVARDCRIAHAFGATGRVRRSSLGSLRGLYSALRGSRAATAVEPARRREQLSNPRVHDGVREAQAQVARTRASLLLRPTCPIAPTNAPDHEQPQLAVNQCRAHRPAPR